MLIANSHTRLHYQDKANVHPYTYAKENERVIESPAISYSITLLSAYDPHSHSSYVIVSRTPVLV